MRVVLTSSSNPQQESKCISQNVELFLLKHINSCTVNVIQWPSNSKAVNCGGLALNCNRVNGVCHLSTQTYKQGEWCIETPFSIMPSVHCHQLWLESRRLQQNEIFFFLNGKSSVYHCIEMHSLWTCHGNWYHWLVWIRRQSSKRFVRPVLPLNENIPTFFSDSEDLKGDMDIYVKSLEQKNPSLLIKRVRHNEQRGLAYARASGWRAATADVVAILDAHIEVHEMW